MAIAFRSVANTDPCGGVAVASPVISAPAGLADGDLIIVVVMTSTTNVGNQVLSGWTLLSLQDQATDGTLFVLYKIASSEGASWTFTDLFTGTEQCIASALAYSGVDNATPLDVAHVTADLGTISTATDTSSITPTNNNCMIVSIFAGDPSVNYTGTADASPTCDERTDYMNTYRAGWIYVQDHLQASAAAEAHTVTPSAEDGICYKLLALRPTSSASAIPSIMQHYRRLRV